MTAILEIRDLCKRYSLAGGQKQQDVLADLNFRIEKAATAAIVGPSGSGKSTLLNLIGGLDRADSGTIRVEDRDLSEMNDLELAKFRNQSIGFVFQQHHLLGQCTVLENVVLPSLAGFTKENGNEINSRARSLLERVGLQEYTGHRPGQLSVGQQQRVAVVRALINEPILLLADEPTGALDRETARNLTDLLLELNESQKVSLIIATHSLELARKMQSVWQLQDGQLQSL